MAEADITNSNYDPSRNYDDESMSMQREIERQIVESQDMIGPAQPINDLIEEYAKEDQVYRQKLKELSKRYSHIRKVRGDGNCFFRSFAFAYLESLLGDKTEFNRFIAIVEKSNTELTSLGFPEFTINDFHETFLAVSRLAGEENVGTDELLKELNDQGTSDYYVVFLRLIVSGHLQKEADFYMNFIEGDRTAKEFCSQEVEPMGKESDHIHIIALSSVLGVGILVEYMDRGGHEKCNQVVVPEGARPAVRLLYRPGHYDILYITNQ